MITNERSGRRGRNTSFLPYCQKETSPSRFPDLKHHLIPLLVVMVFATALLLIPGNEPPGGVPDPEPEPRYRSTGETGVGEFISNEGIRAFVHTADGGYVVLLSTYFDITGDRDVMLVKLTSDGTIQWTQTYGRTARDMAGDLVHTSDGGFALVGCSYIMPPEETDEVNYDIWLLKLNGEGRMQWNTTYRIVLSKEENSSWFRWRWPGLKIISMVQTEDGGFAIVHTERFFLKLSNTGSVEWSKTYGPLNPADYDEAGRVKQFYIHDMVQTADGGFAFTGFNAIWTSTSMLDYDMVLIKTDPNGLVEWNKTYGGRTYGDGEYVEPAVAYTLIQSEDGGFAFTGYVGNRKAVLVKTDDQGDIEWKREYVVGNVWYGTRWRGTGGLIQTAEGGYILLGSKQISKESLAWMAKIDYLYLNNGTWDGTSIVPQEWVAISTVGDEVNSDYGYLWWIDSDFYYAFGAGGQCILVKPSQNLVIAMTASEYQSNYPWTLIQEDILSAVLEMKKTTPTPGFELFLTFFVLVILFILRKKPRIR